MAVGQVLGSTDLTWSPPASEGGVGGNTQQKVGKLAIAQRTERRGGPEKALGATVAQTADPMRLVLQLPPLEPQGLGKESKRHKPEPLTCTPADRRKQSLKYVTPSHPQTGENPSGQDRGKVWHVPVVAPQAAGSQNWSG